MPTRETKRERGGREGGWHVKRAVHPLACARVPPPPQHRQPTDQRPDELGERADREGVEGPVLRTESICNEDAPKLPSNPGPGRIEAPWKGCNTQPGAPRERFSILLCCPIPRTMPKTLCCRSCLYLFFFAASEEGKWEMNISDYFSSGGPITQRMNSLKRVPMLNRFKRSGCGWPLYGRKILAI